MALDIQNEQQLIAYAQDGEPEAIAAVLNYYFNERNIDVKVGWEGETLLLLCEAQPLPSSSELGGLFEQILSHLNIQRGEKAFLYGRSQGEHDPRWHVPLPGALLPPPTDDPGLPRSDGSPARNEADERNSSSEPDALSRNEDRDPDSKPPSPSLDTAPTAIEHQRESPNPPETDGPTPTSAKDTAPSSPQKNSRYYLNCILEPDVHKPAPPTPDCNAVLLSVDSIQTILKIPVDTILPVPYMAPCVLGLYRYRGQIVWIVDLWQQLTAKQLSDRAVPPADELTTLIIQDPHSTDQIGFAIPQLSSQMHECRSPKQPDTSSFPPSMAPFIYRYDPVSRSPILSLHALLQDPRLQMHRKIHQRQ